MPVKIRPLVLATLLAVRAVGLDGATIAAAAEPTKRECVAANENAQDLRRAGKLREAQAQLAVCTAGSCPAAVREDCAQRLKEVEGALPSIVFVAKDHSGRDLSAVRVSMDGEPLVEKLDGTGIAIDPGEHRFGFAAEGFRPATSTIVVREGDADRPLRIMLESTAPPPRAETPVAPADGTARRALGATLAILGIGGIAAGSVFGLLAKSTYDNARGECPSGFLSQCPGQATQATSDKNTADGQALVSTVAFIGGGVFLATGAILFLTAPKAAGAVTVGASVSNGGGSLSLAGRW
jgi:hypothetical protein